MKILIEFDGSDYEDKEELEKFIRMDDIYCFIADIKNRYRGIVKYDDLKLSEKEHVIAQKVIDIFYEELADHEICDI